MKNSVESIKGLLIQSGFTQGDEESLYELAEEISESIVGLRDKRTIADTIHSNLIASGVKVKDIDKLMDISESIASLL